MDAPANNRLLPEAASNFAPKVDALLLYLFGVCGFFAVLVIVLSLIQIRLEGRKERLQRDLQRFGR